MDAPKFKIGDLVFQVCDRPQFKNGLLDESSPAIQVRRNAIQKLIYQEGRISYELSNGVVSTGEDLFAEHDDAVMAFTVAAGQLDANAKAP